MNNDLTAMKYFGGKSRYQIRAWLNGLIPHNPRGLYCEPFAGMLGLLLSRPIAKQEVVNDLESHIINFWRVIGDEDKYKRLERQTRYTHHSRELYWQAVSIIDGKTQADDVRTAWAVYVMLHHGVAHAISKRGWGATYATSSKSHGGHVFADRVEALHNRMKNVQLHNCDATEFLERLSQYKDATIYCDPPYRTATSGYKADVDVEAFTRALKKLQGKCAVSGYGSEWDHLDWHKTEFNINFSHFGNTSEDVGETRTECLWRNFDYNAQQTLF